MKPTKSFAFALVASLFAFAIGPICRAQDDIPKLFMIGDSTMSNAGKGLKGWGNCISDYFDPTKIKVINRGKPGRSARQFRIDGTWKDICDQLRPGDFVMIEFGHNDGGSVQDSEPGKPARPSIKGNGEESKEITDHKGEKEVVHTFGWYIRQYVIEAQAKGATAIVVSMIPRNDWKDGKVGRGGDYVTWAEQAAKQSGGLYLDLNGIIAHRYDMMGQDEVKDFFPQDHMNTSSAGAQFNAACVVEGILAMGNVCPLKAYLAPKAKDVFSFQSPVAK